jgi:hypothetical protein
METDVKSTEKILVKIVDKLTEAQQEIDELAVQLTLGKAEAKDKFEEIKKEFGEKVNEFKDLMVTSLGEEAPDVKTLISVLERELLKGVADTREAFELQKKNLLKALTSLETVIEKKFKAMIEPPSFLHDVEKFKIKLEILRLKFTLGGMEVSDEFRNNMDLARDYIRRLKERAKEELGEGKDKYEHFHEELQMAYKHFRKAIGGL